MQSSWHRPSNRTQAGRIRAYVNFPNLGAGTCGGEGITHSPSGSGRTEPEQGLSCRCCPRKPATAAVKLLLVKGYRATKYEIRGYIHHGQNNHRDVWCSKLYRSSRNATETLKRNKETDGERETKPHSRPTEAPETPNGALTRARSAPLCSAPHLPPAGGAWRPQAP